MVLIGTVASRKTTTFVVSLNPQSSTDFQKGLIAFKIIGLAAIVIGALLAKGILPAVCPCMGYGFITGGGILFIVSLVISSLRRPNLLQADVRDGKKWVYTKVQDTKKWISSVWS